MSRLPLTIRGEGMGPKLRFNYNVMNMENVVIRDTDHYEVREEEKSVLVHG